MFADCSNNKFMKRADETESLVVSTDKGFTR